ncbi:MAG: T9SS type A sorting domain-containing protein, partial [Bacteroidota bacterium]
NLLLDAAEQILTSKNLGRYLSYLTVGNEPMFETKPADAQKLATFTNRVVDLVHQLREANPDWNYEIYAGALNRSGEAGIVNNNVIHQSIRNLALSNPKVEGIDLHIHVQDMAETAASLSYFRNTLNFQKEIIITEYSLQRLLQQRFDDRLDRDGAPPLGFAGTLSIYEYLNQLMEAVRNGGTIDRQAYQDFFESRPWYPVNYIQQFYSDFCTYDVKMATYAMHRVNRDNFFLSSGSATWVFNGLYNEQLFGRTSSGEFATNPMVFPDFSALTSGALNCSTTPLEGAFGEGVIQLSSNPSDRQLILHGPADILSSLVIFDLQGRKVWDEQSFPMQTVISLPASLNAGLYLVRLEGKGTTSWQRVLLR